MRFAQAPGVQGAVMNRMIELDYSERPKAGIKALHCLHATRSGHA